MTQNYYNQPQYNQPTYNQPRYTPQQQATTAQYQQPTQNQGMGMMSFDDPFFNMDIREDFDDPIEHMMGRMGNFPQIGEIQRQFFGNAQNLLGQMENLPDGAGNTQLSNSPGAVTSGMIAMGNLGNGTMISKTYCKKVDYSGGQPHEESYQSQSIKQHGKDGHNISERQEAYKNSMTGVQKAANQRVLDDRGIKMIKQRNVNTGTHEEHNVLKGLREDEVAGFNNQYNDYRNQVHFQDNYKYLNQLNNLSSNIMRLGSGGQNSNANQVPQLGSGNNYGQGQALPSQSYVQNQPSYNVQNQGYNTPNQGNYHAQNQGGYNNYGY